MHHKARVSLCMFITVFPQVMERLCKAHEGKQPHLPTARDAYLRAFAPSALGIPLSGLVQAVGMGKEASVPYAAGGVSMLPHLLSQCSKEKLKNGSRIVNVWQLGMLVQSKPVYHYRCCKAMLYYSSLS